MEDATGVTFSRKSQWRSAVTTMAASVLILCIKLAWTPTSHFAPVAGTLAATEFVLNGQAANHLQHKLALLHAAAMSDDSKRALQHRSPKSNVREQSMANRNQMITHIKDQALESAGEINNTETGASKKTGIFKGNFVSHSDAAFGWDKSSWSTGDWASWLITGPGISIAFSFFMFYTYGTLAGVLTLIVCSCIDTATFYYNW